MSLRSLMTHDVTILRAVEDTDRYGNTVKDWDSATETASRAWVHRRTTVEVLDGREAGVTTWLAYLPRDATIAAGDRVAWEGTTYEVDGPPTVARTPRGPHHIEAQLRLVEG